MRVKVSKVLSNVDFDKCLNDKEHSLLLNTFNDFDTNSSRFSLRSGCDNKPKKNIFKDLQKSIKEIEKEKINQQGEILTNKILGTTTSTRKSESGENKMDEMVQSGGGRKRKHQSDNASQPHIKKRRKYRKKTTIKNKKIHKGKRSPHHKKTKKRRKKKSHKVKGQKQRHYKHHNIFRNC